MNQVLINIDVDDLEAAIQFYTRAFDLRVGRRLGENIAEILGFPSPLYLLKKAGGSLPFTGAHHGRDYSRHWSPIHIDIVVSDIRLSLAKAKEAGARIENEVRTNDWGKIAMCADPFGNGFCLIEFIGRGYDEIASPT